MGKFVIINGVLEWVSDSTYPHKIDMRDVPDSVTCSLCGFTYTISHSRDGKGCWNCIGKWKKKYRIK